MDEANSDLQQDMKLINASFVFVNKTATSLVSSPVVVTIFKLKQLIYDFYFGSCIIRQICRKNLTNCD